MDQKPSHLVAVCGKVRPLSGGTFIDAGLRFRVSAWIEIGFSISFRVCGKRFTVSWTVVFRQRAPELQLTFRGYIAAADHGGLVGVDVQVGINFVICGYALRASGRLAVNPELYQEVRAQVVAFEAELEQAVNKLDNGAETPNAPSADSLATGANGRRRSGTLRCNSEPGPVGRRCGHAFVMTLQLRQVIERINVRMLAGVDQAHVRVAHPRPALRLIEERVAPMTD